MTTYTKGPWTLTQEHTPDDPYGHYYYRLYAGNGYVGGKDENEGFELSAIIHPTNAHLIAAAPEMYEALKAVIDEDCEVYRETWMKIKTAINKAEEKNK